MVKEPRRDRHGWRVFSQEEAMTIVAFAREEQAPHDPAGRYSAQSALSRLDAIEWDFATAKTNYLTHNLHPYPAKFIPQIPNTLIQELSSVGDTIADIFCGSGTTLLESLQLKRNAVGVDANPLAALISRAKTTPLSDSQFSLLELHGGEIARLAERIRPGEGDLFYEGRPFVSSGWRPAADLCEFWFAPHVVEELAELRLLIERIPDENSKVLCNVVFSSIIVSVSKQDSDTRYVRRDKKILPGDTFKRYLQQFHRALNLVRELSDLIENRFECVVHNCDILTSPETEIFDLVVSSPPYPNAYSYHLYHRLRLMWLGYDPEVFKSVEIGSHRKYSAKGARRATEETFSAEFATIFHWLRARLRTRRYACFVIGDSTLDRRRIDNASLIAAAAAPIGFKEVRRLERTLRDTKKAFNPAIGKIKTEKILILQKV